MADEIISMRIPLTTEGDDEGALATTTAAAVKEEERRYDFHNDLLGSRSRNDDSNDNNDDVDIENDDDNEEQQEECDPCNGDHWSYVCSGCAPNHKMSSRFQPATTTPSTPTRIPGQFEIAVLVALWIMVLVGIGCVAIFNSPGVAIFLICVHVVPVRVLTLYCWHHGVPLWLVSWLLCLVLSIQLSVTVDSPYVTVPIVVFGFVIPVVTLPLLCCCYGCPPCCGNTNNTNSITSIDDGGATGCSSTTNSELHAYELTTTMTGDDDLESEGS